MDSTRSSENVLSSLFGNGELMVLIYTSHLCRVNLIEQTGQVSFLVNLRPLFRKVFLVLSTIVLLSAKNTARILGSISKVVFIVVSQPSCFFDFTKLEIGDVTF